MVSLQLNIQDTFWQPALTHTYDLHLVVGVQSLLYSICDSTGQLLALRSYQLPANQKASQIWHALRNEDSWLSMRFRKVLISYSSPFLLLIPNDLFAPDDVLRCLKANFSSFEPLAHKIAHEALDANIQSIYGLPFDWLQVLTEHYEDASHHHSDTLWLRHLQTQMSEPVAIFAHTEHRRIRLAALNKAGEILFYNSFDFVVALDFLYYVLLAYQSINAATSAVPLYISGELLPESEIHELITGFLVNIKFLAAPSKLAIRGAFEQQPLHIYLDSLISE